MIKFLIIFLVFVFTACAPELMNNRASELSNLSAAEANNNQTTFQNDDRVPTKKSNLTLADRAEWKKIIKWDDSCPNEDADSPEYNGGLKFYDLKPKKYLVEIKCSAANYPGYKLFFLYDEIVVPATSQSMKFTFYRGKTDETKEDPKNLTREQLDKLSRRMPAKMFVSDEAEIFSKSDFEDDGKILLIYDAINFPHNCGTLNKYDFANEQARLVEIRGNWLCFGEETDPLKWRLLDLKNLKKISKKQ